MMGMKPKLLSALQARLHPLDVRNPSRPEDRRAAVLLPLLGGAEPRVLGMIRTERGHHGGQFGLPGGAIEPDDANAWAAACREAREEVGLTAPPLSLGRLGEYNTWVSSFRVDVEVGYLPESQDWVMQDDEVAGLLELPLSLLTGLHRQLPEVEDVWNLPIDAGYEFDPADYLVRGESPPRGAGHRRTTPDGDLAMPFIWGLTARILYDFLRHVWIPAAAGDR
ncbi:MAG: CoA pyrophosphatase [Planctomycetes bacterium]|nr:CoA pyrophosphatase [Planctomycetota bacterium]